MEASEWGEARNGGMVRRRSQSDFERKQRAIGCCAEKGRQRAADGVAAPATERESRPKVVGDPAPWKRDASAATVVKGAASVRQGREWSRAPGGPQRWRLRRGG